MGNEGVAILAHGKRAIMIFTCGLYVIYLTERHNITLGATPMTSFGFGVSKNKPRNRVSILNTFQFKKFPRTEDTALTMQREQLSFIKSQKKSSVGNLIDNKRYVKMFKSIIYPFLIVIINQTIHIDRRLLSFFTRGC